MADLRTYTVDLGVITPGSLSFGDLIDVSEASGVDPEDMQRLISSRAKGQGAAKLRLLCAFAWIVARRDEPGLTYQDVLAGQVKVTGQQDRPRPVEKSGEPG